MSGINYRFNEWRESGEKAEAWSPMAYRLISKNADSGKVSGYAIGQYQIVSDIFQGCLSSRGSKCVFIAI